MNSFLPAPFLPIVNGLVGDKLTRQKPKLAIKMSFRVGGRDIPVSELGSQIKGRKIVVLMHGLMADERIWKEMGTHLNKSYPVLYLRYNTGLHISQNGKSLAKLLDSLCARVGFEKLILVGHSMGGLVARSACYYGEKKRHGWVKRVAHIFLIAVPHAGAPLEKIGHMTSFVLRGINRWYLGEVGDLLEQRSDGIKDLRSGFMVDTDWKKANNANSLLPIKRVPVPPIPGVQYHILVGTLSKDENSLMAKYFGDGLITHGSAVAQTLLKVSHVKFFPKTGHNGLLRSPKVYRYISEVLKGL